MLIILESSVGLMGASVVFPSLLLEGMEGLVYLILVEACFFPTN